MGVYYKPSLDFDDKILDLTSGLEECNQYDIPIILGGDFNIKPKTPNFYHLRQLLQSYNLSLISDSLSKTFIGHNGSSTPDHIFLSNHPTVSKCTSDTIARTDSQHMPLMAEVTLNIGGLWCYFHHWLLLCLWEGVGGRAVSGWNPTNTFLGVEGEI